MSEKFNRLEQKLCELDDRYILEKIPIDVREFIAFFDCGFSLPFYEEEKEFIHKWFESMYGEYNRKISIFKAPIYIKNRIFIVDISIIYGTLQVDLLHFINGLTERFYQERLSNNEKNILLREIQKYLDFGMLFDSVIRSLFQNKIALKNKFFISALRDLEISQNLIENSSDTNNTIFHLIQYLEKVFKSVLSLNLTEKDLRRISHDLKELLNKLKEFHLLYLDKLSWDRIFSDINQLDYKMEMRYMQEEIPEEQTVKVFQKCIEISFPILNILLSESNKKLSENVQTTSMESI